MTFKIDKYDPENPQLVIQSGNRHISFSLASVDPNSYQWLGLVLDRQINELVDIRVREALDVHKKAMRDLLGVRS